jgi:transcription initiation factor TFIID subunit 8
MRKQKEAKTLVERDVQGKERFRLWEATMKRFMDPDSRGGHPEEMEIADHSMIVNGDAFLARKEFSRVGKWSSSNRT